MANRSQDSVKSTRVIFAICVACLLVSGKLFAIRSLLLGCILKARDRVIGVGTFCLIYVPHSAASCLPFI